MATPRSVMVWRAGLSGMLHKTVPKFPVEVRTTIRVCPPTRRLVVDARKAMFFLQHNLIGHLRTKVPPPPLYKLRQSPKLIRSLRLL